jgi:hypothetical protein
LLIDSCRCCSSYNRKRSNKSYFNYSWMPTTWYDLLNFYFSIFSETHKSTD